MKKIDLLAIGDTVIDHFIRLKEASVHCKINNEDCEICMRWGDKIPFEFAVEVPGVGNAANAAVAAARLGLNTSLRAYVGEDEYADRILQALKKEQVDTSLIEKQSGKKTNYHFVLWYEDERTILIKHEAYEYALPQVDTPPKWIYLSSLSQNSLAYEKSVGDILEKWSDTKLAFQPGTFQIEAGAEALKNIYAQTNIFFCNKEESQRILNSKEEDIKKLLAEIRTLGPKVAVITDGRKGAYAMDEEENSFFIPMYPDERPPYERTGAGDAFASSVVAALALGKNLQEALLWGPINSMEVVQKMGAQEGLLSREKLEQFLKDAPAEYKLSPLG